LKRNIGKNLLVIERERDMAKLNRRND